MMKKPDPLELYIHIPFCIKKCAYCDFLSGPASEEERSEYMKALKRELIGSAAEAEGRPVVSVFIGGGTPSVLDGQQIAELMETVYTNYKVTPDAEITIEANPGTLSFEKLSIYRKSKINRLSMGLQSTDNALLQTLGRIHTYEEFLENFEEARNAGFDNINMDLMMALPSQREEDWERTLVQAAALHPEHISAYSLIIEEETPFYHMELNLPEEEEEYRMYERTHEILEMHGYHQYEISNYSLTGRECRHNMGYWDRTEYLGFGLGASSLFGSRGIQRRFHNTRDFKKYLQYSKCPRQIREENEILTMDDQISEYMFLGLRKTAGVSETEFHHCFGIGLMDIYGDTVRKFEGMKLLEHKNDRIYLTRTGIHVSNAIMAEFLR